MRSPRRFPLHALSALLRTASLLGLGALSLLGLAAPRPAAAQSYTYTTITRADLGTANLPASHNPTSDGAGITNAGVVVGQVSVGPSVDGAAPYYSQHEGYQYDTNTGAATLLSYQAAIDGNSFLAVSGDGSQVLGGYGDYVTSYFTDSSGHIAALPNPYTLTGSNPAFGFAFYNGINSSATTVGSFYTVSNGLQGFLRGADGTLTTFSDPNDDSGSTVAYGINAAGTTAGYYFSSTALDYTGFLRSANGTFTDFNVPGATETYLYGLSDNDNLFGVYYVYDAAGNLVSIDNFTDVDGVFDTHVDVPGAASTDITGINDAGQISGVYTDAGGEEFSFYGNFNPVPEASSVVSFGLLLMLGGAVVVARRKKAAV